MTLSIKFDVPNGRRRFLHSKAHAAVATWIDGERSLGSSVTDVSVGVFQEDHMPIGDGDMTRHNQVVIRAVARDIPGAQARLENLVPLLVAEFALQKTPVIGCSEGV